MRLKFCENCEDLLLKQFENYCDLVKSKFLYSLKISLHLNRSQITQNIKIHTFPELNSRISQTDEISLQK